MMQERLETKKLSQAAETFFRYFANIAKRPSVLDEGEHFNALTRNIAVWALGIDVFQRETFRRESRKWRLSQYSWLELIPAAREGIQIEGEMALADRIANETRELAFRNKDKGGAWEIACRARENPLVAGHGFPHERRAERLIEIIIMGVSFLRHGPENIKRWIQMPFLQSWTHDLDEAITEQRNIEEGTNLKPKAAHAEADAAIAWLVLPFLEKAGEFSHAEAVRLTAGVMIGNMIHDKPELIKKRLSSKVTAASLRDNPEALFEAWEKGKVSVFSFTLADVMTVLKLSKAKAGFVTKESPNGLYPTIEEIYKKRLKTMSADNSQTLGELLGLINENDKKAFLHILDVFQIADQLDMLIPPRESLLRKLLTPLNRFRPLIRNTEVRIFMHAVNYGKGNLLPHEDSVFNRAMWEILHTHKLLQNSLIGSDPFMQNLFYSLFAENLQFFRETIPDLLHNNVEEIHKIYDGRMEKIRIKAAKKGNSEEVKQRLAMIEANLLAEKKAVIDILRMMPVSNLSGQYDKKDEEFVLKCVREIKPSINTPKDFVAVRLPYGWDTLSLGIPKVIHGVVN